MSKLEKRKPAGRPGVNPLRPTTNGVVTLDGSAATLDSPNPMVIQNPKAFVHHHTYGNLTPFFQGLAQGKLLGTRNPRRNAPDRRIWLPPRAYDPDTWEKMEWVEVKPVGRIYSHTSVLYPGALFRASVPCPLISVEIEGVCTKMMSYLSEGTPEIGMPIRARFNTEKPTNTILDLSWEPA